MNLILIAANNPETIRMINAVKHVHSNIVILGFLDNDEKKIGKLFYGYDIISGTKSISKNLLDNSFFVNLITRDMDTRYNVTQEVLEQGGRFTNFIHPTVNLEMVTMGVGNYIQENVIIQAGVEIGVNSSIHIGALIGHESKIGSSSFVAHGCNLSGFTNIGDRVFLGAGVTTVPKVKIGNCSIIGAGAVVTKDIPPYSVVVGNPARIIRTLEP